MRLNCRSVSGQKMEQNKDINLKNLSGDIKKSHVLSKQLLDVLRKEYIAIMNIVECLNREREYIINCRCEDLIDIVIEKGRYVDILNNEEEKRSFIHKQLSDIYGISAEKLTLSVLVDLFENGVADDILLLGNNIKSTYTELSDLQNKIRILIEDGCRLIQGTLQNLGSAHKDNSLYLPSGSLLNCEHCGRLLSSQF